MVQPLFDSEPDFEDRTESSSSRETGRGIYEPASLWVGETLRLENGLHGAILFQPSDQGQAPVFSARPMPAYIAPERFQETLLDRRRELNLAAQALEQRESVELYGLPGVGKSMLIHYLARRIPKSNFPHGVVVLTTPQPNPADLQQALFETFYDSPSPVMPTRQTQQTLLANRQALVLLDDLALTAPNTRSLLANVPQATFLMTAAEHRPAQEWQSLVVPALPQVDALRLLVRQLARPPAVADEAAARAICTLLENNPRHILQATGLARQQQRSLSDLAAALEAADDKDLLASLLWDALPGRERQVVEALAAFAGYYLSEDHLAAICELDHVAAPLTILYDMHLIAEQEDRYCLVGPLVGLLDRRNDFTARYIQSVGYFSAWASHPDRPTAQLLAEAGPMLFLIDWTDRNQRWTELLSLARPLENALLLGRRWGAWETVLSEAHRAALASGDRNTAGWALHQLGTRALCLGQIDAARRQLRQALNIRQELGDQAGANVSEKNMTIIGADDDDTLSPYSPTQSPFESDTSERPQRRGNGGNGLSISVGTLALILLALLLLVLILFGSRIRDSLQQAEYEKLAGTNISLNPPRLSFGAQTAGIASAPRNVTITNDGPGPLRIKQILLAGVNPASFIKETDCLGRDLEIGQSCVVSVRFQPLESGARQAALIIASNAFNSPHELPLAGATIPALTLNPASLNFGPRLIQTTSIPQSATITNSGTGDLIIEELRVEGASAADFDFTVDLCSKTVLHPGQSCKITLVFRPSGTANFQGELVVVSNAPTSPQRFTLAGSGIPPTPTPTPTPTPAPSGQVSPTFLDFGTQAINTSTTGQEVTLRNLGPGALSVRRAYVSGANPNDFVWTRRDRCTNAILPANGSCTVEVIFRPTARGNRNGILIIEHNGADSPALVTLRGFGGDSLANLCVTPSVVDFGQQSRFSTSTPRAITLRNCGSSGFTVTSAGLSSGDTVDFLRTADNLQCEGRFLRANDTCTLTYAFRPTDFGLRQATLTINTSINTTAQVVTLQGTGN